jgi:hypothetical protein
MDFFCNYASPKCRTFVSDLKCYVYSVMGKMDNIIALEDPSGFKYVHGSKFPSNPKTKCFSSKCQWTFHGVVWITMTQKQWTKPKLKTM